MINTRACKKHFPPGRAFDFDHFLLADRGFNLASDSSLNSDVYVRGQQRISVSFSASGPAYFHAGFIGQRHYPFTYEPMPKDTVEADRLLNALGSLESEGRKDGVIL